MASMETLDGVVSLDNLVVVSQELEPYVLSLQAGPGEDGEMEVVVLAVMKRQAGLSSLQNQTGKFLHQQP